MPYKHQYQTLVAYHGDTFYKLLDAAEKLSEAEYKQQHPYRLGSIHDILFHVLTWHNWWRIALETSRSTPGLKAEDFTTIAALRAQMEQEQITWHRFLDNLAESDFETERVVGVNSYVVWRAVQHLMFHGMQHHSEVAALLTAKGYSPGSVDFIWFTG